MYDHAAACFAVLAASDLSDRRLSAVFNGQVAPHKDDLAILGSAGQPPVDGAAIQVNSHRAPALHLERLFVLLSRDVPLGVGIVADLYGSGRIADGVLQGLPRGGAPHQARLAAAVLGIADAVVRLFALKERAGKPAGAVGLVAGGKLAGDFHAHADLRLVVKRASDGKVHVLRNIQIVLFASGNGAVLRAGTARIIIGNHRLAGDTDRAIPISQVEAAALLLRPVFTNRAASQCQCALDSHAAALIGHILADFAARNVQRATLGIHSAALPHHRVFSDRTAVHGKATARLDVNPTAVQRCIPADRAAVQGKRAAGIIKVYPAAVVFADFAVLHIKPGAYLKVDAAAVFIAVLA